jgi:RNA polymerase sigma factor (sigma-70 family)
MSELRRADSVLMGNAAQADLSPPRVPLRSRRLLRLAGDERLVAQIRRGNEAAFEVVFERYGQGILGFCRHMLGSPEEAEDAVQHTFAAAYRDLQRGEREIALKAWLFTIARNRCLSIIRARRELPGEQPEIVTAGLAEQVERRAELRELLADVRDLPDEQRAALLLAEVGDLAHTEIASVLGCEVARVKALVFRARSGLIARRDARDMPCEQVREQLSELRGGSLRRTELRLHLRECPGCREFREQIKRQRQLMAVALPVAPTMGLKSSVLAAVGIGGSAAAGGGAAVGGASLAGAAKIAAVALVAASGTAVVVAERDASAPSSPATPAVRSAGPEAGGPAAAAEAAAGATAAQGAQGLAHGRRERGSQGASERRGHGKEGAPGQLKGAHEPANPVKPEHAGPKGEPGPKVEGGPKAQHGAKAENGPKGEGGPKGEPRPKVEGAPKGERAPKTERPQPKAEPRSKPKSAPTAEGSPKANGAPKVKEPKVTTPAPRGKANAPEEHGPTLE